MTLDIKDSIKKVQNYEELLDVCRRIDVLTLTTSITRKIFRALNKFGTDNDKANAASRIRIAYLGNITFEPLPEYVSVASSCYGMACESYIGAYDQVVQELMNPGSGLSRFNADVILLNYTLQELASEVVHQYANLDEDALKQSRDKIINTVVQSVELVLSKHNASVLLSNFSVPMHFQLGIADQKQADCEQAFYTELNLELVMRFKDEMRVQILDIEQLTSRYGKQNAFDQKLYYLAKILWQEGFYPMLADQIVRHVETIKGLGKKCLVVDLDNTLWGGVLGEAGVHGIKVGHGDGESEAFYDFQSKILALKNRGILLAICSKNNPEDIEELFSIRTDMPLKLSDFSAREVSWDMKNEGLARIASKLNIGVDSLTFIDDNPAECELIQQLLPEVSTVLLPPDPSSYAALLDKMHGFDKIHITSEDQTKSKQYAEGVDRVKHQASFQDLESYLESLQTEITISLVGEQEKMRAHQLFSKTNQFNVTTKRYSMAEVENMIAQGSCDLYIVHASDRFGDLGIIGLCLVDNAQQNTAFIDSFVLSCRAMGRGIETAMVNFIKEEYLERRAASSLSALFIPTKKNMPAQRFYTEQGFEAVDGNSSEECRYELMADNSSMLDCHWIKINQWKNL